MGVLHYEVTSRMAIITLNRPEKRNALSAELVHELRDALQRAEQDSSVKVIILKANGEAFCAGADLAYLQQLQNNTFQENLDDSTKLKELFLQIYSLKKVVVAQIQGHALAGGCGLATVCDFAFAVPEAKFGYTEVKIGFVPAIVMVFLLRKIGEAKAKSLLLSGELLSADEAASIGLVTKVVPKENLEATVFSFVQQLIVTNSGDAMQITKHMIAHVQSLPLAEALSFAAEQNALARGSADCIKGIDSFLRKEKLIW